jgi:hypothetical protein
VTGSYDNGNENLSSIKVGDLNKYGLFSQEGLCSMDLVS